MLTRRQFLRAAIMSGAAAAMPPFLASLLDPARAATPSGTSGFFFAQEQYATCAAICARIVPTGADPLTDPGATEARAVMFIDRFLSAFELPDGVADNPAIYLHGQQSGRNPYGTDAGEPSSDYPPDAFLTGSSGTRGHFLPLTPLQELSWRCQLYGTVALQGAPAWATSWVKQVGGLIPAPTGFRQVYPDGLAAFDSYSESLFKVPFAEASPDEQDVMLELAGNLVLGASPLPLPSPPSPPAAASTLFPVITLHTFQATYGLPEYAWRNQANDPTVKPLGGTSQWRAIDYTGDTQPLGNSLFDADLYGPGRGPNEGFGEEGVYVPFGGYNEFRPVSTLGSGGTVIGADEVKAIRQAVSRSTSAGSKKGAR